jgi:energy-coupling factor transporter ATP-binding protein EcfA2
VDVKCGRRVFVKGSGHFAKELGGTFGLQQWNPADPGGVPAIELVTCVEHLVLVRSMEACMDPSDPSRPELVGLRIGEYKNLRDVWLPWSDGVALFGVNGAGKTNLLECLALLLGTEQTVALSGLRLSIPAPDNLSVVVRPGAGALPWPPYLVLRSLFEQSDEDLVRAFPPLARGKDDNNWWRMLGVTSGMDFPKGLASAGLPDPVVEFVAALSARPVVRYSLTLVETTDPHKLSRRFARTLLARNVPDAVREAAGQLPDAFGPLRTYLSSTQNSMDPWIDVLELPSTSEPPATLQWLPRARSGQEVNDELIATFKVAMGPAQELGEVLGELPLSDTPKDGDSNWWLHKLGERRAREELELTLPEVSIVSEGGDFAQYALWSERGEASKLLSYTGDPDVLEFFSSGERRWVDEALATVAREFTRFGQQASWQAQLFYDLDEDAVLKAVTAVSASVDKNMAEKGYWSEETFEQLLRVLEPELVAAARASLEEGDAFRRDLTRSGTPGLSLLQPQLVIRAFDEPEAHLHPAAQRRVARALDSLRQRGENVIIASHSPHFLDLQGWSLIHMEGGQTGPTSSRCCRTQSALKAHWLSNLVSTAANYLLG